MKIEQWSKAGWGRHTETMSCFVFTHSSDFVLSLSVLVTPHILSLGFLVSLFSWKEKSNFITVY